MAQLLLSYVGFRYPLLSSSSSPSFEPLPVVEVPLSETSLPAAPQISIPTVACDHALEKLTVVLDLDETLVCAYETCSLPPNIRMLAIQAGLKWFEMEWTSSDKHYAGYARPLVDRIDAENRFSLRLYRPSTVSMQLGEHVKDLSCLSKDLGRVVIVDNNPFSFLLQPLNGIPCIPFSAAQPHDNQLMGVVLSILKRLSV